MRNAKVDANQAEIVRALPAVGASVQSMARLGSRCPDLLVGYRHHWYVLEVKMPLGKLRPWQVEWMKQHKGLTNVVRSVDEALKAIGAAK